MWTERQEENGDPMHANPDPVMAAWRFATERHDGQLYAKRYPYLTHIGAVALELDSALLAPASGEEPVDAGFARVVAILHDILEDTATGREELAGIFGEEVAAGVAALTKDDALPKAERMPDSLRRIRECRREVWLVKLADRVANTNVVPVHFGTDWIRGYIPESALVLRELGEASERLGRRLRDNISRWEAYAGRA